MLELLFASATLLLFISIMTESVTEVIKNLLPEGLIQDKLTYGVSIVVGVGLAIVFDLNPFGFEGAADITIKIMMGMVASRGANYVNGFMKKFEILR